MSVELSYRIVNLSRRGSAVLMILKEIRTVPPEEIERTRREAEEEPETDVVDAGEQFKKIDPIPAPKTQMEEVFSAMRTQFPEMVEIFKMSPPPGGGGGRIMRVMGSSPLPSYPVIEMLITAEQYAVLGSPPLLASIKIALQVV